jgi:hypothetical protein
MGSHIKFIYPLNPLNEREADGPFQDEFTCFEQKGINCSLFDYDLLEAGIFSAKPRLNSGDTIIYRGWMLTPTAYKTLSTLVEEQGGKMLVSPEEFLKSHHITGWYQNLNSFTPQSCFFESDTDIETEATKLGWHNFFVKDYVKSNYDTRGSIAHSPAEVKEIVELIKAHRGYLEGGIALRKVEAFQPETEVRYFVFNGKCYSPDGYLPEIVKQIAQLHHSPFYSIDIIERKDGELRLIEVGDGQVSDRKNWSAETFCEIFN